MIGLEQAVPRLAARIGDHEGYKEWTRLVPDLEVYEGWKEEWNRLKADAIRELNFAQLAWAKRELAILRLRAALNNGDLVGFVRDPVSGGLGFRLSCIDWLGASFWRDIIIGGVMRVAAGEPIALHHDGQQVLLELTAFEKWCHTLVLEQRPCPPPEEPERLPEPEQRQRPKHKQELARRAIDRLWPKGVPDEVRNPELVRLAVKAFEADPEMKASGFPTPSQKTFLRAAGRYRG
jgi:hypothetical protein